MRSLDEIVDIVGRVVIEENLGIGNKYLRVGFEPVEFEVVHAESLEDVGELLGGAVDNVSDFVGNHELKILESRRSITLEANSSPMNSPSLTLMAPMIILFKFNTR